MSPRVRVVLALGAVIVAVASPAAVALAVAALGLAAILIERALPRAWRSLRAPAVPVVLAVALQAWLDGRHAALALAGRVAGATLASAWLLATTRPHEIIAALRRLGAPAALVELAALAARHVTVLGESLRTAREAQRVRLGWQRLGARLRSFGTLGGVVAARAVDQSVAIGEAMRARGGGRR